MSTSLHDYDPLRPHTHDPNPSPPSDDADFVLVLPDGRSTTITVDDLRALPETTLSDCYIVSTGHGTSGPFTFTGTRLFDLIQAHTTSNWSQVEVISADGFGNRVMADELHHSGPAGPILLAYAIEGQAMTRQQGLVRMIVRSEEDDALRQVKWIGQIRIRP
jgi:DMSO/TMAO reductase YedYZ molybdopterin-dependent catalytic subunit